MRWTLRITFLLFLAWGFFIVSPFVALYDLSRAVEAGNVERIAERVNFRALRISLSRQILGAYLKTPEGQEELGEIDPQFATEAGAAVLSPLVEQFLTPQAIVDLVRRGPGSAAPEAGSPAAPLALDLDSPHALWRTFITSESQGFRAITIPFPPDRPKAEQTRLTLRLSGTTWRVTGIDLPEALRAALAKRAAGS